MSDIKAQAVLFGGSFDPLHKGHVEIICALHAQYKRVVIIPTYQSPFKPPPIASIQQRILWLKHVCAPYHGVEISAFEENAKRMVHAIEWVREYHKRYGAIILALGSDALFSLHLWHEAYALAKLVEVLPIIRLESSNDTDSAHIGGVNAHTNSTNTHIAHDMLAAIKAVKNAHFICHEPLSVMPHATSSSAIRRAIAQGDYQHARRDIPQEIIKSVWEIYYNARFVKKEHNDE